MSVPGPAPDYQGGAGHGRGAVFQRNLGHNSVSDYEDLYKVRGQAACSIIQHDFGCSALNADSMAFAMCRHLHTACLMRRRTTGTTARVGHLTVQGISQQLAVPTSHACLFLESAGGPGAGAVGAQAAPHGSHQGRIFSVLPFLPEAPLPPNGRRP